MLLATVLRELFTLEQFEREPEPDLVMDLDEAVEAFARAGQPNGILSGVHAFYVEHACRMLRPGDRVLDLGCGPAQLLGRIAALNSGASFIGVDYSRPMIEEARRSLDSSNVELRMDDMTDLSSVETGSVDVVLSSMAMHHLPDTAHLRRCFQAMERVMAPGARVFVADFGRLKSVKSIEYFVRRAVPLDEPRLEHDYRASLRAAFSTEEFSTALTPGLKERVSLYSTAVSPMMVVLMAPFPEGAAAHGGEDIQDLPRERRADYQRLRMFLQLGGMPCK